MKMAIAALGISSLLFATDAVAADIFTPPLLTGTADGVNCLVLNTGKSAADNVTITLYNGSAAWQASLGPVVLPAGETKSVWDLVTPSAIVYCRVSGISAGKAKVSLCLLDTSLNPLQCTFSP